MSLDDILELSENEFNDIYIKRLYKLREDIKSIEARQRKKNKPLTKNQELMIKMITTNKNSAIITHEDIRVQFSTGCRKHGLKHILLRHFCDDCEGEVTAMDIISIERFLTKGVSFNDSSNKYGYIYEKNKEYKYKLILFKDVNAEGVLSVYKMDRVESEDGANSPQAETSETSEGELSKTK